MVSNQFGGKIGTQVSKLNHIATTEHVVINTCEAVVLYTKKSLWHNSACGNPSNVGKVPRETMYLSKSLI
jgi:hypothetical protein